MFCYLLEGGSSIDEIEMLEKKETTVKKRIKFFEKKNKIYIKEQNLLTKIYIYIYIYTHTLKIVCDETKLNK